MMDYLAESELKGDYKEREMADQKVKTREMVTINLGKTTVQKDICAC